MWRQAYDAAERRVRDLMVPAHHVGDTWAGMTAVGVAEALDGPPG